MSIPLPPIPTPIYELFWRGCLWDFPKEWMLEEKFFWRGLSSKMSISEWCKYQEWNSEGIKGGLHHQYHTRQLSQIRHRSPALLCGSPYRLDKIIFWAFLCLSLRFSPFLHVFSLCQRLFLASKWWFRIFIVCTSCMMSYNALSHSHWGLGQFVGGGRGLVRWNSWAGSGGSEKKGVSRF